MALSCVRIELTTLALSAPRSTDWANGPYTREVSKWQTIYNLGIDSGTFPSVHRPRAKADVKNRDWKNSIRIITISILFEMLEKKLSEIITVWVPHHTKYARVWTTCPLLFKLQRR